MNEQITTEEKRIAELIDKLSSFARRYHLLFDYRFVESFQAHEFWFYDPLSSYEYCERITQCEVDLCNASVEFITDRVMYEVKKAFSHIKRFN